MLLYEFLNDQRQFWLSYVELYLQLILEYLIMLRYSGIACR